MAALKFTTLPRSLAMIAVSAVALSLVDYVTNPRPLREFLLASYYHPENTPNITDPHISLWMNHMCCSGCLNEARIALEKFPWVGEVKVRELPDEDKASELIQKGESLQYANRVDIYIKKDANSVNLVDFYALDQALRAGGLTAQRIEFGGVTHFRLEAAMHHICCGACSKALDEGLGKGLKAVGIKWIDSVSIDRPGKRVTVHARYADDNQRVDIAGLINGLNLLGFSPTSLRVRTDDEKTAARLAATKGQGDGKATEEAPDKTPDAMMPAENGSAEDKGAKAEAAAAADKGLVTLADNTVKLSRPIQFVPNGVDLTEESVEVARSLADTIKRHPKLKFEIEVAAKGNKKHAAKLAAQRVIFVGQLLSVAGVDAHHVQITASANPGEDEVSAVTVQKEAAGDKAEGKTDAKTETKAEGKTDKADSKAEGKADAKAEDKAETKPKHHSKHKAAEDKAEGKAESKSEEPAKE